jgi:hypothetical protein
MPFRVHWSVRTMKSDETRYVNLPEHWRYSSAANYAWLMD